MEHTTKVETPEYKQSLKCSCEFYQLNLVRFRTWTKRPLAYLNYSLSLKHSFRRDFIKIANELQTEVGQVSGQIDQGNELLIEVQGKLEECLTSLKDYLG